MSEEYAAIDARFRISEVEHLNGAISIGNPRPISNGPITLLSPNAFIILYDIDAAC